PSKKHPWKKIKVDVYGTSRTQKYKTMDAQWYRGAGIRLLRIVVVRVPRGCIPIRVYFTIDLTMSVRSILETYAGPMVHRSLLSGPQAAAWLWRLEGANPERRRANLAIRRLHVRLATPLVFHKWNIRIPASDASASTLVRTQVRPLLCGCTTLRSASLCRYRLFGSGP
ncbi:MAG: hypothetical protein V3V08_00235, partial [Nannocystaceae bacterium]